MSTQAQAYHFSPQVKEPRPCKDPSTCLYGKDTPHYASPEDYYAQEAEREGKGNVPVTRVSAKESADVDIPHSQKVSAAVARTFQRMRARGIHLGESYQHVYDATDVGKRDLQRRIKQEKYEDSKKEYQERLQAAQEYEIDENELSFLTEEDKKKSSEVLIESSKNVDWHSFKRHEEDGIKISEALIDKSSEWVEKLSPEEADAVSWVTSNGSSILSAHARGKEDEIWGHDVYSKEHLDKQSELLRSAFDKAPELDEPVTIYRGVNIEKASTLYKVGDEFRTSVPKSFSMSHKTAFNFTDIDDEVVLKVSTKKLASPVAVSAWGTSEQEVFSNPNASYEIAKISQEPLGKNRRNITVVEMVEKL